MDETMRRAKATQDHDEGPDLFSLAPRNCAGPSHEAGPAGRELDATAGTTAATDAVGTRFEAGHDAAREGGGDVAMTLARKHRPTKLSELVGQDALVRVMRAAIEHDRIAQAYILTGERGVGKTTTARIIARSLNCAEGPTVEPCGRCRSCTEIASDASLDVIELDAASRNGVSDMRDLIESVAYGSMTPGARKIYILDEAHMLSTPAWNALLKTLEEPPAHVVFIFATTEGRKIPATIQSRCQRFALRRIDAEVVASHLDRVAGIEGARLEDGTSRLIAQAGEGSMRDALSILDQAISGAEGGPVELEAVRAMIGRASPRAMIDALEVVAQGDFAAAVASWRGIVGSGIDPLTALDDMTALMHQATLASLDPSLVAELGVSQEDARRMAEIVRGAGVGYMTGASRMLLETRPIAAENPNRSQAVEMILIRLTQGFKRKR